MILDCRGNYFLFKRDTYFSVILNLIYIIAIYFVFMNFCIRVQQLLHQDLYSYKTSYSTDGFQLPRLVYNFRLASDFFKKHFEPVNIHNNTHKQFKWFLLKEKQSIYVMLLKSFSAFIQKYHAPIYKCKPEENSSYCYLLCNIILRVNDKKLKDSLIFYWNSRLNFNYDKFQSDICNALSCYWKFSRSAFLLI